MDPSIAWLQPEHKEPVRKLYQNIYNKSKVLNMDAYLRDNTSTPVTPNANIQMQPDFIPLDENQSFTFNQNNKRKRDNRASTYNLDNNAHIISEYGGTPWRKKDFVYSQRQIGLHQEIEHFYEYMSPTKEEEEVRRRIADDICQVITNLWPNATVDVFGSFRTGLYLPTSDIDMMVMGKWEELPLFTLEKALIKAGVTDQNSIKVLDKASVPIVKLLYKDTDISVDISFNTSNGVKSAKLIQRFMVSLPSLPKLVLVLKQFLLERDLNEVFTGGISSYSLTLMTVHFLQTHHREDTNSRNVNLGVLLIEFFELYGLHFNYGHVGIKVDVAGNGRYMPRCEIEKQMMDNGYRRSLLCIEDPLNPSNDIGRSSYGIMNVKRAFEIAFLLLNQACGSTHTAVDQNESILGRIVRITDDVIKSRQRIKDLYEKMNLSHVKSISNCNKDINDSQDEEGQTSSSASSVSSENEYPNNISNNNKNNSQNIKGGHYGNNMSNGSIRGSDGRTRKGNNNYRRNPNNFYQQNHHNFSNHQHHNQAQTRNEYSIPFQNSSELNITSNRSNSNDYQSEKLSNGKKKKYLNQLTSSHLSSTSLNNRVIRDS